MTITCPECGRTGLSADAARCPDCDWRLHDPGAPEHPAALPAGTVLDGARYEVLELLGSGGFALTYRARDRRREREVAIKELFPNDQGLCARGPDRTEVVTGRGGVGVFAGYRQAFAAEAERLLDLRHPHIVPAYDRFAAHHTEYLVMRLEGGARLDDHVAAAGGRLAPEAALALIRPLAGALDYLHGHGLIHRDLKPGNLLVRAPGDPVLIDFGLARDYRHELSVSRPALTEGYAPPEQYEPDLARGPYSDLYSLGAVLYFMLVGEAPPSAQKRILYGASLRWPDGLDPGLRGLIARALDPHHARRPQSAADFLAAVSDQTGAGTGAGGARPVIPFIHGWSAEQVRSWQRETAAARGGPVEFRDRLRDGGEGPEMVWIPPGRFLMGAPESETDSQDSERPVHEVTFDAPFAIGQTALTFADYDRFCAATGREPPPDAGWGRGSRPAINVGWHDAKAYCAWLSAQTGQTYRLPTEAEWEYACRAGTTTPFWTGHALTTDQANYDGREPYGGAPQGLYRQKTTPVYQFAANPWGLYQMHGNVWEWIEDVWHDDYFRAPVDGRAWVEGGDPKRRVLRGGSWGGNARYLRCAQRTRDFPDYRNHYRGFRLARI